jgi:hypothetical protein
VSEPVWCEVRQHYCRCGDYGKRCDDFDDAMNYWQRRCVKAEELLIQVNCDPKWTATVSAHFDKIRDGDKATLNACHMQYANSI